jgi:hypothetical protein
VAHRHQQSAGGSAQYQADGIVDDVRIYDRALSTTEITTLYNGGTVGIRRASPRTPRACGRGQHQPDLAHVEPGERRHGLQREAVDDLGPGDPLAVARRTPTSTRR